MSPTAKTVSAGKKSATDNRPVLLITGAAGGLASVVSEMLAEKYRLVGVDPRKQPVGRKFPGVFHQVNYTQRKMADVFRSEQFHALLHLGRVPVSSGMRQSARFNLNVLGTRNLLDLCERYETKNILVFSTFHVYGAHQHNHFYISEDDPLRASQTFPELSDAVEMDHVSTAFLLKHRDTRTIILRPVNVVGPRLKNQISQLLRADYCPVLLGYDPMLQFMHEKDAGRAIQLALEGTQSGVYNIAGEGLVPYTAAVRFAGAKAVPIPHFLAYPAMGALSRFGLGLPKHLLDYFRFPTIVSDQAFRDDFGYAPQVTTVEALQSIRDRAFRD